MKPAVFHDLPGRYSEALAQYLAGADEAVLNQAYELGRKALGDGLGVLDISMLHHDALHAAVTNESAIARGAEILKAAEFLAETLSPFEMSFRGYAETNARLIVVNDNLIQSQAAAEAANRELEAFSYSVAHDLRAPLRGIDGFSQALLEDYAGKVDEEGRQNLNHLRESAQKMGRLIDDLLGLSRVTRAELRRSPVDLSALARSVAAELGRAEPAREVAMIIEDGIVAEGDAPLLRIALENLLGNAWKFTGKRAEARIEVGTMSVDGNMAYFVRDNGAGFDPAYQTKLFGVFQRLHSTHEFEGTGIGLATVKRIVSRHSGRIWATSKVDRGATFYFTLGDATARLRDWTARLRDWTSPLGDGTSPLGDGTAVMNEKIVPLIEDNPRDEALALRSPPTVWTQGGSVSKQLSALIVEDNEQDATLLVRELRRGGYDLSFDRVETPDAMRAALDARSWDIVLSDYSMPRFSAPAALALVRERNLDLPFIIISGTVGEETAVASLRAGAHDFLVKGSLARLLPAIGREMREADLRSEKKKIQEQLLISERMASVGFLAASVAHEINNPLAILVSNLELASEQVNRFAAGAPRDGLPDLLTEQIGALAAPLRDAHEAAERIRHIARDLKVFSRSDDAESRGPVDIRSVLESAIRMASNEVRHRARLTRDYTDVAPVNGSASRLSQVFLNFIINAAQAIPEGNAESNEIKIVTRMDSSGRVAIEFHDTGAGISADVLPHIFDAFFTTKTAAIGTGLGLAICLRIVTDHDGEISVNSRVGSGTVFRIVLRAANEQPVATPAVASAILATRAGRILVIDDEQLLCNVIERILGADHCVTTVTRATEALSRLADGTRFDLILCDLMMPEMTGMDLYDELKQSTPDQADKFIFMSGGAFTDRSRAFLARSSNEVIEKPFKGAELRQVVSRFLQ
jgi:signal transduction histidine kinase